ncbi:ABC transporter permease [bacterium]|nr:ABC transporter permease [bacterium]
MAAFSRTELSEGLRIALAALKANRMRTLLTTLGIFIGVIVVTVIISVIQGLNHYVSSEFSSLGANTMYVSKFPWIIRSWEEFLKYQGRKDITEKHYRLLVKNATLAEAVAPDLGTNRTVKYRTESLNNVYITGTTEAYLSCANTVPETGRFFSDSDVDLNRAVCVIGWEVKDKLFKGEDPIDRRVKIGGQPFTVVGVMEKRGNMFGQSMDATAYIPYTAFQKMYGSRRSLDIQIKAADPEKTDALVDQVTGIMRQARGLTPGKPDDFAINQQSQIMDVYNQMTRTLWIVLIGIGSISLLVGGIGIMNIMMVSVSERTREIGIRKAIGAKKRVILWQFLMESIVISGLGVTIGILISLGIALLIRAVSPIPVYISTYVLFLGVGFTLTIGLFFGIYPASKAARLDPIVALRYE